MKFNSLWRRPVALLSVSMWAVPMAAWAAPAALPEPAPPATPSTASAVPGAKGAVAAEVNGEKILAGDVERMITMIKDKEPALQTGSAEAKKALADLRESMLDNFIVQRLLVQEAKKRGITPTKLAVDKGVVAFKAGYPNEEVFKKSLSNEGKTPEDVRRIITEELAIRELTTQITADVTVTDADISDYYNRRKEDFALPEMVRARHILLAYPEKATAEQKKQKRTKAEELLKKVQAQGADFAKIARENSDDPGTKDVGGDLDFATRGTFVKSFEDAVFSSPSGVVPRVVESEFGLHIIKVEQKEPARQLKLEQVKNDPQLRFAIRQSKIKKRLDEQIAALKAKAKITRF